jgi:hypothetical protein
LDRNETSTNVDYYEHSNEIFEEIGGLKILYLKQVCREEELFAYGADECSVNYGKNESIFVELKSSFDLPYLIGGFCNIHIFTQCFQAWTKITFI